MQNFEKLWVLIVSRVGFYCQIKSGWLKWERRYRTGDNLKVVSGRVFNFKLGRFTSKQRRCIAYTQPPLKLKTRPGLCPVSWRLSKAMTTQCTLLLPLFIKWRHDIEQNDTKHNGLQLGTRRNGIRHHVLLWVPFSLGSPSFIVMEGHFTEFHFAECHFGECHFGECHFVECHFVECHFAQCHFAESH